jgi:DNA replication protein DnaC
VYIDHKENILPVGKERTGKFHLACALEFAACGKGKPIRSFTFSHSSI